MPTIHTLPATVHGRYLLQLPQGPGPHPLVVGFHGYGENAELCFEALQAVAGDAPWALCALQALHPFYNLKTDEVVASWMTRQDRQLAIEDNVAYVRAAVASARVESGEAELGFVGFSQGVAMAYRAAARSGHTVAGLFALGGDIPPDLAGLDLSGFPAVCSARGESDTWYTERKQASDLDLLRAKGVRVESMVVKAGHEWTADLHTAARAFLRRSLCSGPS